MTAKLNTGALWPNKYKRSPRDPDLQGQININGELVKIVAWYGDNPSVSIRVNERDKPHDSTRCTSPVHSDADGKQHPMDVPPEGADNDIPF